MNFYESACLAVLLLSSALIIYSDLRDRQVALWVLLLLGLSTICSVLVSESPATLGTNVLATLLYMGFTGLMLKLYLYAKHRQWMPILDVQLGKADVLVVFFLGLTFNPPGMILFFCFGFTGSLLIFMAYRFIKSSGEASIPLAALLVFCYLAALIVLNLFPLDFIACSFVRS